jgi:hypothetical protein
MSLAPVTGKRLWVAFLRGLVARNAKFDKSFLEAEFSKTGKFAGLAFLDTMELPGGRTSLDQH